MAFSYAFNNGADFICVGMYNFQIVDDVNILLDTLANVNRIRPWRGYRSADARVDVPPQAAIQTGPWAAST